MKKSAMIFLIRLGNKCKPILIRLLPIGLLREAKKIIADKTMQSLGDDKLSFDRKAYKDGMNIIGSVRSEIGLGQSCRLVVREIEQSAIPFSVYNYEQFSKIRNADDSCDDIITNILPYNINIIHINPYELPFAYINLGRDIWDKRYNIAFWLWELETFPPEWLTSLLLVDEIWTPSEFASAAIRKITDKPVVTVPYALTAPTADKYDRVYFGLSADICLFLCMYDCSSTIERKNPIGVIRAFKRAFGNDTSQVCLVIKLNNPQEKDIEIINRELEGYQNISIIADILTKIQINSLIKCCDVVVSLHRAEGFGLVPAEAMLLGTAVISTNWSSTSEFMTDDTVCLVDYEFCEIKEDVGSYKKGWRWANPNVEQAAEYMRKLYVEPKYRSELAERAKLHIKSLLSFDNAAERIKSRIE
ncbi:MAG: glycosyltransferase family 4 protein, partial [Treponema sp.]|nr:glycosyltransferase family 4 protein [Treponema sp.]